MQNPEIIYYETSAMDGSNVNEAFQKIAQNFLSVQNDSSTSASTHGEAGTKKFDLGAQQ